MKSLPALIFSCALALLTGCNAEAMKRGGYSAVKIHNCNEQINDPACSEHYPSYDEYQRERKKIPE